MRTSTLTNPLSLLVAENPKLKHWYIGTTLTVHSEIFLINTKMARLRQFSSMLEVLCQNWTNVTPALKRLNICLFGVLSGMAMGV